MTEIDTRDLGTIEGFDIVAVTLEDADSDPRDTEAYDPENIDAWRRDEWRYVGIEVRASRAGVLLGSDSVWGLEDGTISGRDVNPLEGDVETFASGYGNDLIKQAIEQARTKLAELTSSRER